MAKFMYLLTQKPTTSVAIMVILMLFLLPLFQRIAPLLPYSWNLMVTSSLRLWILIKRPPFIYVIFNFIIVYILLSSTFSLPLKFFYKRPKSSSSSSSQPKTTSYSVASSGLEGDRDTWWCQIVDDDDHDDGQERDTASFEVANGGGEREAASFEVDNGGGEKTVDDGEEREMASFESLPEVEAGNIVIAREEGIETASFQEVNPGVEEGGLEGDDTLDATWEAIMEAKRRGSGPQLKKSDTWTTGNEKGRLGREKIAAELKKWQTFKGAIEERENRGGDRGRGGGGGGWRRMEAVVTDHDELKKRSDAFISRFTHDIRLQRLKSDQRFLEMINRGL